MSEATEPRVLILGAGYCGLAAATELSKHGAAFVVAEKQREVGGLSKTLELQGHAFELGPHIYFDKDPEVNAYWKSLIGKKLETHERHTRIFYRGKYISSPLRLWDAISKIGPLTTVGIFASFLKAKLSHSPIENAQQWVTANFGQQLYERFFKVYNEKIWGLPCEGISPNWAGQRIKSSLVSMVWRSLRRDQKFVVKTFNFPRGGSRVVYQAQEALIASYPHGELRLNCQVSHIAREADAFYVTFEGQAERERFTHVISTIHLSDLQKIITYPAKDEATLTSAIKHLRYRNLVLVNLIFPRSHVGNMNEHWIDIHDPKVQALRVTNFSNYDAGDHSPNVALGIEYNCFDDDEIWNASDEKIAQIAQEDLQSMGLVHVSPAAVDVVRVEKAYPVYFKGYEAHVQQIFAELGKVDGLILAGRNAMYKWNNMHHSVKTGMLAVRNVLGAQWDLWAVQGNVTIGKDSD